MAWNLAPDRPIYLQLMEEIELRIISGVYPLGSQLSSVRELAAEASVNPNTMQKALSLLEGDGMVHSMRTSGRFITEDESLIAKARQAFADEQIDAFLSRMRMLGFSREQAVRLLQGDGYDEA